MMAAGCTQLVIIKTDGVFYSETPFLYTVTNSTEQDILPTKLQLLMVNPGG